MHRERHALGGGVTFPGFPLRRDRAVAASRPSVSVRESARLMLASAHTILDTAAAMRTSKSARCEAAREKAEAVGSSSSAAKRIPLAPSRCSCRAQRKPLGSCSVAASARRPAVLSSSHAARAPAAPPSCGAPGSGCPAGPPGGAGRSRASQSCTQPPSHEEDATRCDAAQREMCTAGRAPGSGTAALTTCVGEFGKERARGGRREAACACVASRG